MREISCRLHRRLRRDLDANGNFVIKGTLSDALPNPCATPLLLIRKFAANVAGAWFAAGIPEN